MSSVASSSAGAAAADTARLQHAIRSKTGVQAFWGIDAKRADGFESPENTRALEYSKDGSLLAVLGPEQVQIFSAETGQVVFLVPRPNVFAIAFSPLNTFAVTWERLDMKVNNNENNLIVWRLEDAQPVAKFTQNALAADLWPSLAWTKDEVYFTRIGKSEILFYAAKTARPGEVTRRMPLANVARAEFAPTVPHLDTGAVGNVYHLSVFVPALKSQPGSVRIYAIPPPLGADPRSTASKTFFRGTNALFLWNSTGTALIASLSTDEDVTGRSYYGETGLYFLAADGSFDAMVQLPKEGPIHDVRWAPSGLEFAVIYGFMPNPQSTLFDLKCRPVIEFGTASRNTIRWSPNGRFLCLGGFGNLTGQMDFYDVKAEKKIGSGVAHCAAICEWAPDSRHLIAAVVSPRIRVDNGYKIFKYDGTILHEAAINELYQVSWRPYPPSLFRDRPLTPPPPAGVTVNNAAKPAPAPAKYRHPHAHEVTTAAPKKEETAIRRVNPSGGARSAREPENNNPPGWDSEEEEQQQKAKNKKKTKPAAAPANPDVQKLTAAVGGFTIEEDVTPKKSRSRRKKKDESDEE